MLKKELIYLFVILLSQYVLGHSLYPPSRSPTNAADYLVNFSPFSDWISTEVQYTEKEFSEFVTSLQHEHLSKRNPDTPLAPLLIIPPLTGSQIQAQLHNAPTEYWYCSSNYDTWYVLWIDTSSLIPFVINCFLQNMQLEYNTTQLYQTNRTGVWAKVSPLGSTDGIECIDSKGVYCVWNSTILVLEALGYQKGVNIIGAAYDWRTTPLNYYDPENGYFMQLKGLIEEIFVNNSNTKVVVTSLSMGCPVFVSFLNYYVTLEWKQKYLSTFISLDGAYGGSLTAIQTVVSSETWVTTFFSNPGVLPMMQTMGSVVWMAPWGEVWGNSTVILKNPSGSYSPQDFGSLLHSVNATGAAVMLEVIEEYKLKNIEPIGIPMHVVYGFGVPTPYMISYNTTTMEYPPNITFGDGDGTVCSNGLTYFAKFNSTSEPVFAYPFKGMMHGTSVHNPAVLRLITSILLDN